MKPRSRQRYKGRREGGTFTAIPHALQDSANWRQCSGTGIKLLLDIARQYNGRNNGDLSAAMTILKSSGWSSPDTLNNALKELRHYGFLILTRQGGLNMPSLYALSWLGIDPCGGKLTCATPGPIAPGTWKIAQSRYKRPAKSSATTKSLPA
ncbi:hypothetical protein VDG05_10350 [Xanthomonas campestris pv. raphani]|uniref:hypothetical protein n=1 Tax=Xanthomonas campestris TaxID=339 RepID=UPI002B22BDD9|nr:hypothetical protein [Xanthomonas campestris]MEA9884740.1 hypothetical protein [Xanthomonas campestris pv. raphani]MEB2180606.1 hypothetical protein [Xanthomonas campestris pv. campestris]